MSGIAGLIGKKCRMSVDCHPVDRPFRGTGYNGITPPEVVVVSVDLPWVQLSDPSGEVAWVNTAFIRWLKEA